MASLTSDLRLCFGKKWTKNLRKTVCCRLSSTVIFVSHNRCHPNVKTWWNISMTKLIHSITIASCYTVQSGHSILCLCCVHGWFSLMKLFFFSRSNRDRWSWNVGNVYNVWSTNLCDLISLDYYVCLTQSTLDLNIAIGWMVMETIFILHMHCHAIEL